MSAFHVLVDSSVWVDHFRYGNKALVELLEVDRALSHPMVTAELACGTPPAPRAQTLRNINLLKSCQQASLQEVMTFIEREALYGRGCGLVDICLLTSTLITPDARLWTLDKRLADLANQTGVAYQPPPH